MVLVEIFIPVFIHSSVGFLISYILYQKIWSIMSIIVKKINYWWLFYAIYSLKPLFEHRLRLFPAGKWMRMRILRDMWIVLATQKEVISSSSRTRMRIWIENIRGPYLSLISSTNFSLVSLSSTNSLSWSPGELDAQRRESPWVSAASLMLS